MDINNGQIKEFWIIDEQLAAFVLKIKKLIIWQGKQL